MYKQFNYVSDEQFLKKLDLERNKIYYTEIVVLDMDENPIQAIQAKISQGTININGDSSVRRTCQLTFLINNRDTAYTDINYLLTLNRKVKISIGIENHIDKRYGEIIGFPQGIFVISQIALTHNPTNVTVNMSCKDKMCLLNGECGGNLPTSVTFDSYDQLVSHKVIKDESELPNPRKTTVSEFIVYKYNKIETDVSTDVQKKVIEYRMYSKDVFNTLSDEDDYLKAYKVYKSAPYKDGERISVKQRIYDIIQTAVVNYGGESISNVFINDIELKLKQLSRWTGTGKIYYNNENLLYTTEKNDTLEMEGTWRAFNHNEDIGYEWTDFIFPGELVSGVKDNVCSILDKIKNTLGNYEYFYDINGRFIFQEIKNYLNKSYNDADKNSYRLDSLTKNLVSVDSIGVYTQDDDEKLLLNEISILDSVNYRVDFANNSKVIYIFDEDNGLINSYANNPTYTNIKNDYHIWGKNKNKRVIHYHLAIKEKLIPCGSRVIEIPTENENEFEYQEMNIYCEEPYWVKFYEDDEHKVGQLYLVPEENENAIEYYTTDWRAELYMQGLSETQMQQRPDIYKQELLDLFDDIYNFKTHSFRADIVTNPNELTYWFDFLEPVDEMMDISVDNIGMRTFVLEEDNVVKLFDSEAPDVVMINIGEDAKERADLIARCRDAGVPYSNIPNDIYTNITQGTVGYSAQELCRGALYQYITDRNTISLQCVPIYHLEVNNRITVRDIVSDISGDYIIKTISLPLDARNMMTITATAVQTRI